MKKKLSLILITVLGYGFNATAQFNLNFETPNDYAVVNEPPIYWDLMRTQFPSWIRQIDMGGGMDYVDLNKFIQQKDAKGKFNSLEAWTFQTSTQKWELLNKQINSRSYNGNQIVNSTNENWQNENPLQPLKYQKTVFSNQYFNSALQSQTRTFYNINGDMERFENYKFAYQNNLRIADTLIINGNLNITNYDYDFNGNCVKIKRVNKTTGVESMHEIYNYENNKLAKVSSLFGTDTVFKKTYKYTNGLISEAVISYSLDEVFSEREIYKHGYTDNGQLKWMCNYELINDNWVKMDSMYFNYKNNKIDTSYGFTPNELEWKSIPDFRLIFNENIVGIKQVSENNLLFNAYPNPSNDIINIESDQKITSIKIIDIAGAIIYDAAFTNKQINISSIKAGIYFLHVDGINGIGIKKIIIN